MPLDPSDVDADISLLPEITSRPTGYFEQSRGPLASLALVGPLLIFYEVGVLVLGPGSARNGADAWLRQLLDLAGFGQYFVLPVLTVAILLAWHYATRRHWRLSGHLLGGMVLECAVLSVCVLLLGRLQSAFLFAVQAAADAAPPVAAAAGAAEGGLFARLVGFVGAGVYEELLFRLMLLPAAAAALRLAGLKPAASLVGGAVLTSLAFAAAHYVGPLGDDWQLGSFVFRFLAGGFFAVLFVLRGFGIAAGSHAGYDILVGVLLPRSW
ncbi:MAG: CPBP family glutamic-type intramembrane protease [Pirellulales bacterium]